MRQSFTRVLKDPDLLEEARRLGVEVNWINGEQVLSLLNDMYEMPKDVIARVAKIFVPSS